MKNSNVDGVVVTGLGPVTSIGVGNDALWASLVTQHCNVNVRTLPLDLTQTAELPVASMPDISSIPGLAAHMDFLAEQECESSRDLGYALLAIELALADAGIHYDREANNLGAVQAFEAPAMEQTVCRLLGMFAAPMPTDAPPAVYDVLAPYFYKSQAFFYVHIVGKAFGLRGFSTSVHNACSSGAFAMEAAAQRIRSGQADVMIVVGGEAFETAVRLEWFRRLDLYACDGQMRPFDAGSSGFYVGEGAGAIVLESAAHAAQRGADVYAGYLGGAFTQQGWKQAIPDVRSSRMRDAITQVMAETGVSADELDLIVPHGASTSLSDGYESSCLSQALDGKAEKAVGTVFKPYVGHMLAASGVIETICSLLAMKHNAVPATLNSRQDHVKLAVPLATTLIDQPVNTLLKVSTGFTGHDAALLFRRE